MLPVNSRTLLGVVAQPIRGFLFAIALWLIRDSFRDRKNGWLVIWLLLLAFGILSTPSASPNSIEGVLYSKLPLWYHLIGLPEISLQTLTFSLLFAMWDNKKGEEKEGEVDSKPKAALKELFTAVVIGVFSYIRFAISSLAIFFFYQTPEWILTKLPEI